MKPQDLLNSYNNQELLGIAEALPKVFAERGMELPATIGSITVAPEVDQTPVIPTWEQSLEALSAEQRKEAVAARGVLSKEYERPETDFSLIHTFRQEGSVTREVFAVVLSSTKGIDLGDPRKAFDRKRNWNSLNPAKPNKQFMVEIDGKELDVRVGLTLEVMRELTARDPKISEWIWETGRPDLADDHLAPIIDASGGYAYRGRISRVLDDYYTAFRPAVELG